MGIQAKRFPEYDVILQIFRGEITPDVWLAYYADFSATEKDRFVTYIDKLADLSGLDIASGPELKRVVAARLRQVYGDKPVVSILVPGSEAQEAYLQFWRGFEAAGEPHPAASVVVPDLEKACELLGLPDDAWKKLAEAVER